MLVWCSLAARPGLALEPPALLGVAEQLRRQDLQGDVPAQRDLLGLVDDPHAAAADLAERCDSRPAARGAASAPDFAVLVAVDRLVGQGDVLHHRHRREDLADLAGQLGMAVDILLEGGRWPVR